MRSFLRLKNPLLSFTRLKSKSSSSDGKKDKQAIEKLDHESTILFGEPLKNVRRKSRKKPKILLEDEPSDECIYYEIRKKDEPPPNSAMKEQSNKSQVQLIHNLESPVVSTVHTQPKDFVMEDDFEEVSVDEPVPLFPLFNESKKEYAPGQVYYINPMQKRIYKTFPTVTAILTETMTEKAKTALSRWKDTQIADLGKDQFEEQQRKQLQLRNIFLKLIQKRLLGVRAEDLDILPEFQGYWRSLDCVFPLLSNLMASEKIVTHPELQYRGMIDSILEFRSKPVLVSWKKSSKLKSSIDMTFDAPIQIAAYIGALNYDDSYPFKIEESLMVMSYEDGSKADIFHLKKENCLYYWKSWLQRLHLYQTNRKKLKSKEQETKLVKSEKSQEETKEQSKGFSSSVYSTFLNVPATPTYNKKPKEFAASFPIYNEMKKEYVSGHLYEIEPVKQTIHSGYPSVTSILNETKSESSKFVLNRWKNNLIAQMGEEGFEKYHKNLLETGTLLHNLIQQRLMGTAEKDLNIAPELAGCWKSLQGVFPLFSDIKITESYVVHEKLKYKGVIDCIAEFRGKPVIIDWKKSDKIKASIDMTYDGPLQIAAYIGATNYDEFYPFRIEEGLLIMSYIDGTKADIFYLNKESCQKYWNLWFQRLMKYKNMIEANDLKINY